MPLSPPVTRDLSHTRAVQCQGFRRADGLWDIEGHLVDTKAYDFQTEHSPTLPAGDPVHDMWIRMTVDDDLLIHGCEASMAANPYPICADVTPNFEALKGIRIGKGWMKEVNRRVGGTHGCTHLRELLRPMATTAYQTIYTAKMNEARAAGLARPAPTENPPRHLNTCHAYSEDSDVVKVAFPEFYKPPQPRRRSG